MLRSIAEEKERYNEKELQKREVLSLEWKSEGVMGDESGESMEPMGEVPLIKFSPIKRRIFTGIFHSWNGRILM